MATSRLRVVGAVALLAMLLALFAMDAEAQRPGTKELEGATAWAVPSSYTGPIQLAYAVGGSTDVYGGATYYAYAAGGGLVAGTQNKNDPATWWQPGFDSATPNLVTLFNSAANGFLSNNGDSQVVDTTEVWWHFYETGTAQSGQPAYKIGNSQKVRDQFFSFNGAYTLDGANDFTIVTGTSTGS